MFWWYGIAIIDVSKELIPWNISICDHFIRNNFYGIAITDIIKGLIL